MHPVQEPQEELLSIVLSVPAVLHGVLGHDVLQRDSLSALRPSSSHGQAEVAAHPKPALGGMWPCHSTWGQAECPPSHVQPHTQGEMQLLLSHWAEQKSYSSGQDGQNHFKRGVHGTLDAHLLRAPSMWYPHTSQEQGKFMPGSPPTLTRNRGWF